MKSYLKQINTIVSLKVFSWWHTVDRITLFLFMLLILMGFVLVWSSSEAVASRVGLPSDYFIRRHSFFAPICFFMIIFFSSLSVKNILRVSLLGFVVTLLLLILLPFIGTSIKGATRWIYFYGISLQPSEFIKPFLIVMSGLVLTCSDRIKGFPSLYVACGMYGFTIFLIMLQPDLGMSFTICLIFAVQLWLYGINWRIFVFGLLILVLSLFLFYFIFPHVQSRIDGFFNADGVTGYQINRSLDAFNRGGLFGVGVTLGTIKKSLPDVHTDFILAASAEEFGLIFLSFLFIIWFFILIRGFKKIVESRDKFFIMVAGGLLSYLFFTILVNMYSTIGLIPPKGTPLPLISYGGSAMVTAGISMGIYLSLLRQSHEQLTSKFS